jgi:hypothetical protein
MSLKLDLLSFWMPDSLMKREIKHISDVTLRELDRLINENSPSHIKSLKAPQFGGSSRNMRIEMSSAHEKRVKLLIQILGRDKAILLGREALFSAGQELGSQLKGRLKVGGSLKELIKAARILYKVLGIDFEVEKVDGEIFLVVNRCQLAEYYSPDTCLVLSATDEGVVQGLNPLISMNFNQRIVSGFECCLANIRLEENIIAEEGII